MTELAVSQLALFNSPCPMILHFMSTLLIRMSDYFLHSIKSYHLSLTSVLIEGSSMLEAEKYRLGFYIAEN